MAPSYSRHQDVDHLIRGSLARLVTIDKRYQESLHAKSISSELLVEVKHYLGDMKSALDYSANRIPGYDEYFPVTNAPAEFANRVRTMPADVAAVFERWQPYNNHDWLKWFNALNNKIKHVALIPQKRSESRETRVTGAGGGSVSWGPGVTFGGGVEVMGVPIDPRTQLPVPNQVVKTEIITWVDFVFDNTAVPSIPPNVSALPLIKAVGENVPRIVAELEAVI